MFNLLLLICVLSVIYIIYKLIINSKEKIDRSYGYTAYKSYDLSKSYYEAVDNFKTKYSSGNIISKNNKTNSDSLPSTLQQSVYDSLITMGSTEVNSSNHSSHNSDNSGLNGGHSEGGGASHHSCSSSHSCGGHSCSGGHSCGGGH